MDMPTKVRTYVPDNPEVSPRYDIEPDGHPNQFYNRELDSFTRQARDAIRKHRSMAVMTHLGVYVSLINSPVEGGREVTYIRG